jgi:hypothetical protein
MCVRANKAYPLVRKSTSRSWGVREVVYDEYFVLDIPLRQR